MRVYALIDYGCDEHAATLIGIFTTPELASKEAVILQKAGKGNSLRLVDGLMDTVWGFPKDCRWFNQDWISATRK